MLGSLRWQWTASTRPLLAIFDTTRISVYNLQTFAIESVINSQENAIQSVFWSDFDAILAVISTTHLSVYRPRTQSMGQWNFVHCFHALISADFVIQSVDFAPNSEYLIVCCEQTLLILALPADVSKELTTPVELEPQILWKMAFSALKMAKFSIDPTIFALLESSSERLCVWKMKRIASIIDRQTEWKVVEMNVQSNATKIDSFSWNLTFSKLESDRFSSQNVDWKCQNRPLLLTKGAEELCIWTLNAKKEFVCCLRVDVEPNRHFGWVRCSGSFTIEAGTLTGQRCYISEWNEYGDVRMWQAERTEDLCVLKATEMCVRVPGAPLQNVLVTAYGKDSSTLGIYSCSDDRFRCHLYDIHDASLTLRKESSWEPFDGDIVALTAHPTLPLIATATRNSHLWISVSWISCSMEASARQRLIPCGRIRFESQDFEWIQWIHSSHFDAIPLLLIAFSSGILDIYGYQNENSQASRSPDTEQWLCMMQLDVSPSVHICVCPLYDDEAFIPDTFVLLAIGSCIKAWKCSVDLEAFKVHCTSLEVPLKALGRPKHITCVEGGKRSTFGTNSRTNTLQFYLFVGNRYSELQYWRCSVEDATLCCSKMSTLSVGSNDRILRIRVNDLNRVAVLTSNEPHAIHIIEAESGLGTLCLEASIDATEDAQSFAWGSSQLTSYFDPLLVAYRSEIVVHRCTCQGNWVVSSRIPTACRIFECTRDASLVVVTASSRAHVEMIETWGATDDTMRPNVVEALPFWHPFVLLTTIFGMHPQSLDRMQQDTTHYDYKECLLETVQLLQRFVHKLQDEASTDQNETQKPRFQSEQNTARFRERKNSSMSLKAADCARNLFTENASHIESESDDKEPEDALTESERQTILSAIQQPLSAQALCLSQGELSAQLTSILSYISVLQTLPFDLTTAADLCGIRFYLTLLFTQTAERHLQKVYFPSSSILWALHSDSQPFLIDKCFHPKALWNECQYLWPGLWVRDICDLRQVLERLAKARFTATKDVFQVCLHYAALGRRNILCGLTRLGSNDECKHLSSFLEHDFTQERWSLAAIKNAYSLLAKKRFELAAAFFLLSEPPRTKEAVHILWKRMKDPSLALVIARVTENRSQPLAYMQERCTPLKATSLEVARDFLLQYCRNQKDRWMESAVLWWLEDYDQACTVLLPLSRSNDLAGSFDVLPSTGAQQLSFFMDLTSLSLYFEWIHSNRDTSMLRYAMRTLALQKYKSLEKNPKTTDWALKKAVAGVHHAVRLVTSTDIEHAFSYSAYVCKRCGLIDTALMEMMKARRLVKIHSHWEKKALEAVEVEQSSEDSYPSHPMLGRRKSEVIVHSDIIFGTENPHSRRASTFDWASSILTASRPPAPTPWLRTQINDVECRKAASCSFVVRLIGQRIAQKLVKCLEGDMTAQEPQMNSWDTIWESLCDRFEIDRMLALEGALEVLIPHAMEHITACCVILYQLGREVAVEAWLEYMTSMLLHDVIKALSNEGICSSNANCMLRHLNYILFLDNYHRLQLSPALLQFIVKSIQALSLALAWRSRQFELVQEAVTLQLDVSAVDKPPLRAVRKLWTLVIGLKPHDTIEPVGSKEAIYLAVVLRASLERILPTELPALQPLPSTFSCLYVPKKLYGPAYSDLMGLLRQWMDSSDSHLSRIFRDRSLPECLCGLYGLENARIRAHSLVFHQGSGVSSEVVAFSRELARMYANSYSKVSDFLAAYGITTELHDQLLGKCDDYILLLMQHEQIGVEMTLRRLRREPRIHIKCFMASKAVVWLTENNVFDEDEASEFLKHCCKQRKLRLLVTLSTPKPHPGHSTEHHTLQHDQMFMFVEAWEVEAEQNTLKYLHRHCSPAFVELGGERLSPCTHNEIDKIATNVLQDQAAGRLWGHVNAQAPLQALLRPNHTERRSYFEELYAYCRRNALVRSLSLPYQFIGVLKVSLRDAVDMSANARDAGGFDSSKRSQGRGTSGLVGESASPAAKAFTLTQYVVQNKPYAFLQLENGIIRPACPDSWSLNTYRSSVGSQSVNPSWNDQEFAFRFAIPTHSSHSEGLQVDPNDCMERLWAKREQEDVLSVNALDTFCRIMFRGPPTILHCSLYSKNKLFPHQFLGHGALLLEKLSSSMCMDCWLPLTTKARHPQRAGRVHLRLTLAFEIMRTSS